MKDFFKDCFSRCQELKNRKYFFMTLFLVLAVGTVGFGVTTEKAQKIKVQKTNIENAVVGNIGSRTELLNPLRKEEYPKISDAVKEHFAILQNDKEKEFVEKYDGIQVYTKVGQLRGTYIVFAKYQMKIKDIYTKVPGLATLYAMEDEESGKYQINTYAPESIDEKYIQNLMEHKDVQRLMTEAEEEYETAILSDALLKEALLDLKNAYENSKEG